MPKLYLIRHGRTAYNREGRIRAHHDIPLDDTGKRDAKSAGKAMAKLAPEVDCVYCADLKRSQDTAQAICDALGGDCEITPTPEMRPWHLGSLTGQKVSAVLPLLNWYQSNPDKQVTRGESYNDFFDRWCRFLAEQIQEVKKGEHNAVVVHARHLLSLDHALKHIQGVKVDTGNIPADGAPNPTSITVLNIGDKISRKLLHEGQPEVSKIS